MPTIGEILRQERTRRGLSIKDVEQVLHIRAAYLEALEIDKYKEIPGDVYVKGFIRSYASFLGLDGQKLVNSYKQFLGEPILNNVRTIRKTKKKKINLTEEKRVHKRLSYEGRVKQRKKRIMRERLMVGAFLFFVFLFIIYLFFF